MVKQCWIPEGCKTTPNIFESSPVPDVKQDMFPETKTVSISSRFTKSDYSNLITLGIIAGVIYVIYVIYVILRK